MKRREMIQRVDKADEAGTYRPQIGGFQRERFEEVFDLLDPFDRRIVCDGFAGEPAADRIDRAMRNLQGRPPGGLERDLPSRFHEGRVETTDSRFATRSGDPNDELREVILPRIENNDARKLEEAAECR